MKAKHLLRSTLDHQRFRHQDERDASLQVALRNPFSSFSHTGRSSMQIKGSAFFQIYPSDNAFFKNMVKPVEIFIFKGHPFYPFHLSSLR